MELPPEPSLYTIYTTCSATLRLQVLGLGPERQSPKNPLYIESTFAVVRQLQAKCSRQVATTTGACTPIMLFAITL